MERLLVDCGAVRFGSFTLTSGQQSDYYVDVKAAMGRPDVLGAIADEMTVLAKRHGPFAAVAGMELGAVPIATAVSLVASLPLLVIRKAPRAHGTGRRIEGSLRDLTGKPVLVVEDVTTSGGSTRDAVRVLREAGATVEHAYVVVDRESGATGLLAEEGVMLHPLCGASTLLRLRPGQEQATEGVA